MNEEGHNLTCTKTGDGTVTYHSLSWAHSWLGSKGSSVRVTQTPQSVYFSADNITRVRAVRHAKTHHAEYSLLHGNLPMCEGNIESSSSSSFFAGLFGPVNRDRITFFESSTHEDGAATSVSAFDTTVAFSILTFVPDVTADRCVGNRWSQAPRHPFQPGISPRVARRAASYL